jgi:transcriptional regulator with XRE-family HTH domain
LPFCRVTLKGAWQPAAYPKQLNHIGDHIRRRRLDLGLTQREAAKQMGVKFGALKLWERGRFDPTVSSLPRVAEFLGYEPKPKPSSFAQRLSWHRQVRGLSQAAMARQLGVNPRTLSRWESGEREPAGELRATVEVALQPAQTP